MKEWIKVFLWRFVYEFKSHGKTYKELVTYAFRTKSDMFIYQSGDGC